MTVTERVIVIRTLFFQNERIVLGSLGTYDVVHVSVSVVVKQCKLMMFSLRPLQVFIRLNTFQLSFLIYH